MGTAIFGPAYEDPSNPRVVYAEGDVIQAAAVKLNRRTNAWEPFLGGAPAEGVNFSPDGEWVAYVKWPDAQLWKCRRDGSRKVMLEDRLFSLGPYWSPDGTRLAFTARERTTRGEPDQPWHVYTISSSGGKPERVPGLTQPALGAAWSPDGKRIAFFPPIEDRSKLSKQPHILIVNLETGAVEPVPGTENILDPRWSPDGKYLSARTVDDFKPAIYDFATRNWRILQPAGFGAAHWSKDSRYLYSTVEPGITLVRMDVATGKMEELRKLTEFKLASVMWPDVYWTPEDEPVALKQTILDQIYRIERDR